MAETTENLKEQRDRFVGFAFASADMLLEVDTRGAILYASGASKSVAALSAKELVGRPLKSLVLPAEQDFLFSALNRLRPGTRMKPIPIQVQYQKGKYRRTFISGFMLPGSGSDRVYLTMSRADRMPSTNSQQVRDEKTGLLDKKSFVSTITERVKDSAAIEESLSFLVIKGIEKLEEECGSGAVERFTQKIAARVKSLSIGGDSAGLLADNKLGILHEASLGTADLEREVSSQLSQLQRETGVQVEIEGFNIDLTVPGMSDQDSERALAYAVKQFADSDSPFTGNTLQDVTQTVLRDTVSRIGELRDLLDNGAFDIVFQPIVNLETRDVHHYEVLTRTEGSKSPFEMIRFAEEVGLIEDFDLLLTQRVMERLSEEANKGHHPIVFANLSARSLNSGFWFEALEEVLSPYTTLGKQIGFEITETVSVNDFEAFNNRLQMLRDRGHMVCIDDLGKGATSFQTLDTLRVDLVKIDGAYVQGASQNARHMAIIKSMVSLCHDMKIPMVAEMIDTERQVRDMLSLGIQFGQGFLFARPGHTFVKTEDLGVVKDRKYNQPEWI